MKYKFTVNYEFESDYGIDTVFTDVKKLIINDFTVTGLILDNGIALRIWTPKGTYSE